MCSATIWRDTGLVGYELSLVLGLNFIGFTRIQAAGLLSVFLSACQSVNINHNRLCCQSWGLQLRLYILGNIWGGQLHQSSTQSQYHLLSTHTLTNFWKCDFSSNGEKFHRAWADGIHRQTWEANATAAIEMWWDNVPTFLRVWGKKKRAWDLECLRRIVISDLRCADQTQSSLKLPSVLTLAIGSKTTSEGKFHIDAGKRPEG